MQIKTRAKFVSAILDFYYGPKLWIPDACERVHIFALNAPGLNLEAPSSKIDDFLHCALYYTKCFGFGKYILTLNTYISNITDQLTEQLPEKI